LVSPALTLMAREKLDTEPDETGRLLDHLRAELEQALRELRDQARGIHPAVLADRGLGAAAEAPAREFPAGEDRQQAVQPKAPRAGELTAYFVVSETLTNVAKHAAATKASVALTQRDGRLAIEDSDDGDGGADLDRNRPARPGRPRGTIDGRLEIDSKPHGTIVRARLPCPEAARGRGLSATVSARAE
jgi:signal transduction histidine kinase